MKAIFKMILATTSLLISTTAHSESKENIIFALNENNSFIYRGRTIELTSAQHSFLKVLWDNQSFPMSLPDIREALGFKKNSDQPRFHTTFINNKAFAATGAPLIAQVGPQLLQLSPTARPPLPSHLKTFRLENGHEISLGPIQQLIFETFEMTENHSAAVLSVNTDQVAKVGMNITEILRGLTSINTKFISAFGQPAIQAFRHLHSIAYLEDEAFWVWKDNEFKKVWNREALPFHCANSLLR